MTVLDAVRIRRRVRVLGLVQGVGFRPFVHEAAHREGLDGFVGNDADGVFVEVEGEPVAVERFVRALTTEAPPLARVDGVATSALACRHEPGFAIVTSEGADLARARTYVAPDAAVCADCLAELHDPTDRRHRYPFITCTNCGPRFTITRSLPYDRPSTTMAGFPLCRRCEAEYRDPLDRRFHAQPLACPNCGPSIELEHGSARVVGTDAVLAAAQRLLADGRIVAIKGIGGYHLACDARSPEAVARLRARKHRADKPFAVLVADVAAARRLALVDDLEAAELASSARPIVLLRARPDAPLAMAVAPGNPRLGVLLPYSPLHHLLVTSVPGADVAPPSVLVFTSGNLTDEPICFDDDDARRRLGTIADALLTHDRPIHVPCDDSVVRVIDGTVVPLRRSRGHVPMPLRLPVPAAPLLAVGGELKNTFCLAAGRDAWLGQHIGDMGSIETLAAFEASTTQFRALYGIEPVVVACDLHPGYHTTGWAERSGLDLEPVQHHHAHFASLLAEHGEPVDARAIGVVFDGTGCGTDGTIWGGEVLVGGYAGVERAAHLTPVPLPGGDAAVRHPARVALAHLWTAGLEWDADLPPVAACSAEELTVLRRQLEREVRCLPTTSMGRLFDAVASLLGVRHEVTYEAQAALELEELAVRGAATPAPLRFGFDGTMFDPAPVLAAIVTQRRVGASVPALAAGFHDAVAQVVVQAVDAVARRTGVRTVGLTGGVFQNAVLVAATRRRLEGRGLRVLTHAAVPPNDGGLALGQAAVAAARRQSCDDHDEGDRS